MSRLKEKIKRHVLPAVTAEFGYGNPHQAPRLRKIVVNVGLRSDVKDPKHLDEYRRDLAILTGQRPISTVARKSISSFKIRQGQVIGLMVTLRGERMHEFLDKLITVTLPRVRDFRGLDEQGFDQHGNYSIGLRDQQSFPEISAESVGSTFGIQITISLEADSKAAAVAFLRRIGLPLKST